MTWAELNAATAEHGLAVTGGAISTTGHRRADARRRARLADGEVRPGSRQPARRRARDRRRRGRSRSPTRRTPTCSGRCAAAAATSASPPRSPTGCTRCATVTGGLIAHPIDAAAGVAALLPRRRRGRVGRSDGVRRRSCTRRTARAPSSRRSSSATPAIAGAGRARPGAVQGLGLAAGGRGRPDAVPGDEHHPRRRISRRCAQLLAVELHPRASPTS